MRYLSLVVPLLFLSNPLFAVIDTTAQNKSHFLNINSIPTSAKVFINGESYGNTPLELNNMKAGIYKIRIENQNDKPFETSVVYSGTEDTQLYPILDGEYGMIRISCAETNAKVFIDDSLYGVTPLKDIKINLVQHNIRIEKKGFDTFTRKINTLKRVHIIDADLISSYGSISLVDSVRNSTVYIDGKLVKSEDLSKYSLLTGEHELAYKCNQDNVSSENNFEVKPDKNYVFLVNHRTMTLRPFLFSYIVPGLGQFQNGHKLSGVEIFGGTLISGVLFYLTQTKYDLNRRDYNNNRTSYLDARNEYEASFYKDLMARSESLVNKSQVYRNISIGLLAVVYVYNLFDALLNHSIKDEIKILEVNNIPKNDLTALYRINVKIPFEPIW